MKWYVAPICEANQRSLCKAASDTLLPVAFTGRPYFGMNKIVEGASSKLSYIEVTNAQHFDAFLGFPGYAERLVPLHRYFVQAMDMMYANLKTGAALPDSQVVRTVPRGLTACASCQSPSRQPMCLLSKPWPTRPTGSPLQTTW